MKVRKALDRVEGWLGLNEGLMKIFQVIISYFTNPHITVLIFQALFWTAALGNAMGSFFYGNQTKLFVSHRMIGPSENSFLSYAKTNHRVGYIMCI